MPPKKLKFRTRLLLLIGICALLNACSTQHSQVLTNLPPHRGKVFVTEQSLPPNVEFELISTIEVGKRWYGGSSNAITSMADRARELGANAVIQAKTWFAPSGFAWAAPHASGQAVRVKNMAALESASVPGNWQ